MKTIVFAPAGGAQRSRGGSNRL